MKLFQIEVNETSKREIGALLVLFTFSGFTGSCINLCKQKIDWNQNDFFVIKSTNKKLKQKSGEKIEQTLYNGIALLLAASKF